MRWKLFIPLAIILTVISLAGSYYFSLSASNRSLDALSESKDVDISLENNSVYINLDSGQALAETLKEFEFEDVANLGTHGEIFLVRAETNNLDLAQQVQIELLVAEAASRHEYYTASQQLKELAAHWGYKAEMILWADRLVAEVGDSNYSYIVQIPVERGG